MGSSNNPIKIPKFEYMKRLTRHLLRHISKKPDAIIAKVIANYIISDSLCITSNGFMASHGCILQYNWPLLSAYDAIYNKSHNDGFS